MRQLDGLIDLLVDVFLSELESDSTADQKPLEKTPRGAGKRNLEAFGVERGDYTATERAATRGSRDLASSDQAPVRAEESSRTPRAANTFDLGR
jgi:hypothetical protein